MREDGQRLCRLARFKRSSWLTQYIGGDQGRGGEGGWQGSALASPATASKGTAHLRQDHLALQGDHGQALKPEVRLPTKLEGRVCFPDM